MLWVIGGRDFSNWTNDVWYSKDGVLWKEATPKADFSPRSGHTSVIYDNLMWVLGGSEKEAQKPGDIWFSKDGTHWDNMPLKNSFLERVAHTTTVFDKKMWVVAGLDVKTKNDVWVLSK